MSFCGFYLSLNIKDGNYGDLINGLQFGVKDHGIKINWIYEKFTTISLCVKP
jgi:hypothetical protein